MELQPLVDQFISVMERKHICGCSSCPQILEQTRGTHSTKQQTPKIFYQGFKMSMQGTFGIGLKSCIFYYSTYFCYYSWVSLHFLVLFMSLIVLFQLLLVLSTVLLIKSFQFQLNKLFSNGPVIIDNKVLESFQRIRIWYNTNTQGITLDAIATNT